MLRRLKYMTTTGALEIGSDINKSHNCYNCCTKKYFEFFLSYLYLLYCPRHNSPTNSQNIQNLLRFQTHVSVFFPIIWYETL